MGRETLTAADVRQFETDGYFLKRRALTADHALECRQRIEAMEAELGEECNVRMKIKAIIGRVVYLPISPCRRSGGGFCRYL